MKVTILGCGSSYGVPRLGCDCGVCRSSNTKNKRSRSSILIQSSTTSVVVDTGGDFYQQALRAGISKVDAVIYTHAHSDHVVGINDLRNYHFQQGKLIPAYMTNATYKEIYNSFEHAFAARDKFYKPFMEARIIEEAATFSIGDISFTSFPQEHGNMTSIGLRTGNFVYSTDCKRLPPTSMQQVQGCEIFVTECLRFEKSFTHASYEEALSLIELIKPKLAFFTHMDHELEYDQLCKILPENVRPLFDGLEISISS